MAKEAQKGEGKSQRQRQRFELALPVRVLGRESLDDEWIEMSRLVDVTPFGARLRLKRPSEPRGCGCSWRAMSSRSHRIDRATGQRSDDTSPDTFVRGLRWMLRDENVLIQGCVNTTVNL